MNFWHLVRVLKMRWMMIAAVVAATLLVILLAAPKPRVVYEASSYMTPTAQVMSGGVTTTTGGGNNNSGAPPDRGVILSNLIILAQGGDVYQRALDFLAEPDYQQKREAPGWRLPYRTINRPEIEAGKPLTPVDWADVLEVTPVQNPAVGKEGTTTDVIQIRIKIPNGFMAPYLANAVGHAFSEAFQEKSREDTRRYAQFLESSQRDSRAKLHDLQEQITKYKSQRNVVAVDAETQNAISSLASLDAERMKADADAREAEAAVRDIDAQLKVQPLVKNESLPAEMNPVVGKLKDELAQAETDMAQVARRYKSGHPLYQAAAARITSIKQRIAKEGPSYAPPAINDIHQSLVKKRSDAVYQLAVTRARLASVNNSVAQAQSKVSNLAKAEPKLAELMRDYTQEESSYKMISEKLAQTLIAEKEFTRTGSIVPLDWATEATGPIVEGPTRKMLLIYGFLLSLAFGVVLVVWLDSIDNKMRNATDVEKLLELPVLGLTPSLPGRGGMLPKLTHIYPLSAMAESYKILRTNILFALRDTPFKTMMVATGRPGQGATTTVCNLAIALAQIGKRIILIDADMRRPSLHKFFGVPNDVGLSTLLQGTANVAEAFQKTEVENLIVLPAGPQPLNPSELLGSDRMQEIVQRLEEHCDLVLFDTPSTIVFSDGPMLASWIDAVVMVVSANQAPRGTEVVTRDLLRRAKANILGVVVNKMSPESVDSCFYYSHYYSDSIPKPADFKALDSGNGNGDELDKKVKTSDKPKAIPAATVGIPSKPQTEAPESPSNAAEDNPFPD
ncbi:MAG: polysaccharide biosynthesis tyrosine autokinase [Armatimonadetes bacterium]|nr:polysaccharide biosynthesis tyrosine autokinase [Armatimonadota bacterium]